MASSPRPTNERLEEPRSTRGSFSVAAVNGWPLFGLLFLISLVAPPGGAAPVRTHAASPRSSSVLAIFDARALQHAASRRTGRTQHPGMTPDRIRILGTIQQPCGIAARPAVIGQGPLPIGNRSKMRSVPLGTGARRRFASGSTAWRPRARQCGGGGDPCESGRALGAPPVAVPSAAESSQRRPTNVGIRHYPS